jgi:hypothetical protein
MAITISFLNPSSYVEPKSGVLTKAMGLIFCDTAFNVWIGFLAR